MYWFKWLQLFKNDKKLVKTKNFMVQCNVTHAYTKIKHFKEREPIFIDYIEINVIIRARVDYNIIFICRIM
ncbi:hypothetical protein UT300005_04970 [Clostridium sp. CTA-5]